MKGKTMKRKKSKRRRVAREQVAANAADGAGRGAGSWMDLPEGVREWHPETAGVQRIDVVPYEVTSDHHPDRVEKGCLWYKYPFAIHYGVGVENTSVVCPTSVGRPCPICEERNRLAKNWAENEEVCRSLRAQKWVAYNIVDPDDPDRVALFAFSRGKFAAFLETELTEGDEDNLAFYDVTEDGRTLKVRFSKDTYDGKAFIKATRLDFIQRDAMDEDEILGRVVCLDEVLQVWDYDKLKADFLQSEGSSEDEDEDESDGGSSIPKRKLPKPKARRSSQEEDEDDESEDEDEDWDEDSVADDTGLKPKSKKARAAVDTEEDEIPFEDDESEDQYEDEEPEPEPVKKPKKKPGPKAKPKAAKKPKKKPGPKAKRKKKGPEPVPESESEDDEDDWDDDE